MAYGELQIIYDRAASSIGSISANAGSLFNFTRLDASVEDRFRITKMEMVIDYDGKTSGDTLSIWLPPPGMSAAEVEAALEADPQGGGPEFNDENSLNNTWLPYVGSITGEGTVGTVLNAVGGPTITIRPNVTKEPNETLSLFLMAFGTAFTTGATLEVWAKIYGVWLRD